MDSTKAKYVDVLGVKFDYVTMKEAIDRVMAGFEKDDKTVITTANPEIVMMANKEPVFMELINSSDMVVADGIGVIYGSKILKNPLPERVAGYDMILGVFGQMAHTDKKCYFLGAGPGITKLASEQMSQKFPGLQVVGFRDGYFSKDQIPEIIKEINSLDIDFLLVGLGAPKQEKWIHDFKDQINAKVFIGCGGSFDAMSGHVKRAPKFFIKIHLEWFYRLLKQPKRAKRMLQLPIFMIEVIKVRFKNKHA